MNLFIQSFSEAQKNGKARKQKFIFLETDSLSANFLKQPALCTAFIKIL